MARRTGFELCLNAGRGLFAGARLGGASSSSAGWMTCPAMYTQTRGAKKSTRRVEVMLTQDIPNLGRDGEVLEVKPGRARNHLVPLKMARYATADRLDEAAARRASWADQTETIVTADDTGETDAARVALNILTGSKLVVKRIASKDTKNPRVPVDAAALVAEILRQRKLQVDRRTLLVDKSLSTFGDHVVPLW
eukprot:CAMPEP_0119207920 /NCGR_PEP_ID=MMETSP1327-20130426/267_1 /TAXON_ID=38833 /ORGANISM="Micromonas pusilla, Strain RCC2306" /LENGTH=193 /DNA_ID=CAMNT_0007204339 /DNA_START=33 /DNA_END=611 /DNA_ORIENTATION=+